MDCACRTVSEGLYTSGATQLSVWVVTCDGQDVTCHLGSWFSDVLALLYLALESMVYKCSALPWLTMLGETA
jgi:hypothetical protein